MKNIFCEYLRASVIIEKDAYSTTYFNLLLFRFKIVFSRTSVTTYHLPRIQMKTNLTTGTWKD